MSSAVIEIGSKEWQALPAAERAERIKLIQATAGAELATVASKPGVRSARHAGMALGATFERGRVSLLADTGGDLPGTPVELAVAAWGCEGAMEDVPPAAMLSNDASARVVSYAHTSFDESYTFGPAGLEQGIVVRALPNCAKSGQKLRFRLRFSDSAGALAQIEGDAALLTTPGGRGIHYTDPYAQDARGTEHGVRIIDANALALEIDASDAVLPLTVDPLAWADRQEFTSSDAQLGDFAANDFFGYSVAVSGDTALVGAYGDRTKGSSAGAAYVFTRVLSPPPGVSMRWARQQKLTASDGEAGDFFGFAVALSGNTALVGAYGDDDKGNDSGAAYVFARSGTTWVQQQKLEPSDPSASSEFGFSVALSTDTAVIGAPLQSAGTGALAELGAAYAFNTSGAAWAQQQKFAPPVAAAQARLHFGAAVAVSGNSAAIGRDNATAGGVDWFTRTGTNWSTSGSGVSSTTPHFGSALAMTDTVTAIGAYGSSIKGAESGSVSVTSTSPPHAVTTLTASDGGATDFFGIALAISGNTLMVGAPNDDDTCPDPPFPPKCGTDSGAVYVFTSDGTAFTQQQKLKGPYSFSGDHYGSALALSPTFALVGAPNAHAVVANQGAVWSEQFGLTLASPCTTGDACASGYCVDGVCCEHACPLACQTCSSGLCLGFPVNTDPKNGCAVSGTACGTTGACDGKGACAATPVGTMCGTGGPICSSPTSYSVESTCISTDICAPTPIPCGVGYACKAGACKNSCTVDSDCDAAGGFECTSGVCKIPAGSTCKADSDCGTGSCGFGVCCTPIAPYGCSTPPGALCSTDDACFTHHCVDGVCCNSSCNGPCEACGLLGTEGICTPAKNDPGDAPGSCSPIGGSGGQAGEAGANPGGGAGAPQGGGGAAQSEGGTGGALLGDAGTTNVGASGRAGSAGGVSGAGTSGADAAGSGGDNTGVECVPACAVGLVCNHQTGRCQDELVTACGCRAAGGRGAPLAHWALAALALASALRRRKSSHAST